MLKSKLFESEFERKERLLGLAQDLKYRMEFIDQAIDDLYNPPKKMDYLAVEFSWDIRGNMMDLREIVCDLNSTEVKNELIKILNKRRKELEKKLETIEI